jgi:septal ring factor EnvC (AmiA/AmiB activator)
MGSVTEAAAQGGSATLVLALSISSVVITLLLGVLALFVRDKLKQNQQYRENLENRLKGGTETMKELAQSVNSVRLSIESVQREYVERLANLVTRSNFEAYCRDHERIHNRLEDRLVEISDQQDQLVQRVELGIKGMSQTLAKLVDRGLEEAEAYAADDTDR